MKKLITIILLFVTVTGWGQLTNELVVYFKFEETTGSDVYSEVNDAVLNGVIVAGTSINQTGKIGKCYSYTTNGDGVMMSDVEEIQMYNSDCAMSAWIYATTLTNTEGGYAFTIVGGQETDAAMFYVTPTSGLLRLNGYNISAAPISNLVVTINTWHHVGFSYDQTANELTYFMDGEFDTVSYSHEFDPGASSAYIGKSMSDEVWDVNDFVGNIDEVGIWKRKLTVAQIDSLYNSGDGLSYPFTTSGYNPIAERHVRFRKDGVEKKDKYNLDLQLYWLKKWSPEILSFDYTYGYDSTYALASTQKFAIPENVENGDYVGYWKHNYTWMSGNSITYTIETNYNNAFTVNSSTGLISIADYSIINGKVVQQDTLINIIIRTTDPVLGYELDTAKIWVKETSYCKFYDFTTSGTGTRASPYNDMDAIAFSSGYGYFLKRGAIAQTGETTVLTALIGTSSHPTIFAAYGAGEKPKFVGAGTEGTECFFLGNSTDAVNGRCEYLYFYDIAIRHYGSSAWKARTYTNNVGWYNCDVYNNSLATEYPALSINDQTYADSIIQRPFEFINHVSDTCPASHIKCGNGPLRITNIYCHGGTDGIRFALGNNGYIKHAYINRTLTGASDDAGIQIRGDNILIEDVRIIDGNGAGIDITSTTTSGFLGMPDNVKVKNAYINGVGGYGIGIWKPDASSMTGVNDTIEDCIIANAGTRGIRINSGGGHVIQRNIIYGSGDYGIYAYTVYQMNNLKIYYNIIYNSTSTDLYLQNGSGHTVYNNVVDGSAIFTSSTTTVRNNIFSTISGGNTVSNNLLIPDISTANYFVDYASHNYRLKSTATNAINAGYDVGIDYDIAGNAVSSPPEIGAYEYEE